MCCEPVPFPAAAPPLQNTFDVRGWSIVHRPRTERRAQCRADALSYHGHFIGYTLAPKLLHCNPASPQRSHEFEHTGDTAPPRG